MKRLLAIDLPLWVILPRKTKKDKKMALNLNIYRNLNFMVNNQMKHIFKEQVAPRLVGLKIDTPIEITYTVFYPTKRLADISNVCCVVDKFFCDTLVETGVLEDDNYTYIPKVIYAFGGIDKDNPRCEAVIRTIEEV